MMKSYQETKNNIREEASLQTIQTLQTRVAELEATVTELKLENIRLIEGGYIDNPVSKREDFMFEIPASLGVTASNPTPWNSDPENHAKYPDIEILQTPGYASASMHSKFDEIERRNQKIKRALNIEGYHPVYFI